MAHLNVRERRVEAKVAYVGPELSGKSTNLEMLGKRDGRAPDRSGDVMTIAVRAPESAHFRDCDVTVNLVARRGALTESGARSLFEDVDGVVLVVDARPDSREKNRAIAKLLSGAVAPRKLPVIVQINKNDLPDSLAASEVLSDLDASWPHISASAKSGEGVLETLERMLAQVLETLGRSGNAQDAPARDAKPNGATSPRVEGNPLLAALRQVLRDTVSEHVLQLEERFKIVVAKQLADETALNNDAMIGIRQAIDSNARAVKELRESIASSDPRQRLAESTAAITFLGEQVTKLATLLQSTHAAVREDATDKELREATADKIVAIDETMNAMHEQVLAIADEIKRRKKGFF